MQFEELEAEAYDILHEKSSRKKRGQNVGFVLIEEFENKSELDQFWAENDFSSIYNHHMERTCKIGSKDFF